MPRHVLPVPSSDPSPNPAGAFQPGLLLRLRTRRQRRRLDEELSRGADPAKSPELALRAAELCSPNVRSRFANAFLKTLADARWPAPLTLKLHPHRAEIRDNADDLLALVLRLLDSRPIEVRGAAMVSRLLTAGASPLDRDSGERLRPAVRAAHQALDLTASDRHYLPTSAELLSAWRPAPLRGDEHADTGAAASRDTVRR